MLRSRERAPGRAFTIRTCQMWREVSAHEASPCQYATTNASLRLDGHDLLAPLASLPPCRGTSRDRMRGVGATCTAPTTHGRPKRAHVSHGMLPDRRGLSPFRQNGNSRLAATGRSGFRRQIDGLGWPRAPLCIDTRDPPEEARVARAGWQAPIFRQESEGGIRRRMRRQPGGESGWRCCLGMEPSNQAAGTYGVRFGGPHHGKGNGGCCEVGEPAGAFFDATARNDQHR